VNKFAYHMFAANVLKISVLVTNVWFRYLFLCVYSVTGGLR